MEKIDMWIQIVTALATGSLAIFAWKALDQISISKNDIKTREKRASVNFALEQIAFFREKIMPEIGIVLSIELQQELKLKLAEDGNLQNFTYQEIQDGRKTIKDLYTYETGQLSSRPELSDKILDATNLIEQFAVAFMSELADERVPLLVVGTIFCDFVKTHASYYCRMRKNNDLQYYHSTIELYKKWNKAVSTEKLKLEKLHIESKIRQNE